MAYSRLKHERGLSPHLEAGVSSHGGFGDSAANLLGLEGLDAPYDGGAKSEGELARAGRGRGGTMPGGGLSEGVRANPKVVVVGEATVRPEGAGRHGGRATGVGRGAGAAGERTASRAVPAAAAAAAAAAVAAAAAAAAGPAGDCCLRSIELPPLAGLMTRPDGNGRHPGRTTGVDGVGGGGLEGEGEEVVVVFALGAGGVGLEGEGEEAVFALEVLVAALAALEGGDGLGRAAAAGR